MDAVTQAKSPSQNRLEGFALNALFVGLPTYAGAVLTLKLMDAHEIVGTPGAAIFVVIGALVQALLAPALARRFPNFFRHGHEPVFYDPRLSFVDKIALWRSQPLASLQLVTSVLMLSVLAVGVASMS
ncbi:MAG: hypothetical protein JOY90_31180 [Bradyrhizobium sp.]|uniref:hypothetical protein n=1 Tax=Bradyrhizobium sp. TaxID=376 RepID=UPI001DA163B6|nr:hypothetical protein [Bradyrhizobium sp.]MBV9564876.1 hypothetical protein [Bradyrhizobium sp.]